MSTHIKLDSHHLGTHGRPIDHQVGTLKLGPPRRFLFRWVDEDGYKTELVLDEESDGTFRAVFEYPDLPGAGPDVALASVGTAGPEQWEIEVSGIHEGKPYDFTIEAAKKPTE